MDEELINEDHIEQDPEEESDIPKPDKDSDDEEDGMLGVLVEPVIPHDNLRIWVEEFCMQDVVMFWMCLYV